MEIKEMINNYWSKRADEFSECRLKDFEGLQRKVWTDIISEVVPNGRGLRALDVGTGAGFFAFLLADMGFEVTAVDYSQRMIQNALANVEKLGYREIEFLEMDAQNLKFEDGSFDFIISRNVTWTLPDPKKAYKEWCRVLTAGGKIMNFDANYGQGFRQAEKMGQTYKQMQNWSPSSYNRKLQSEELICERNNYAKQLYISNIVRPQWDVDVLIQNGINKITIDTEISKSVYVNKKLLDIEKNETVYCKIKNDSDSQMFMVCGTKGR
ncbi:class I SAM-dependent methyltransferase [Clostridium sp. JS66]|uniref:class I SAM-dependent methyltransferase n=1 Tax=Clostridium sp. JS66 TaxID=3064705 RepID=UPI00298ECB22|nr:class I SAM-dependent methyltransferase [Clostridium sp. JS66]WPC40371.1 class I SAM-dependent methyltransferase [Clostridium sp. JS66]